MGDLKYALERIKNLECPTGEVENRVAEILEDYNVVKKDEIIINKIEDKDNLNGEAYSIVLSGTNKGTINIYAKSGLDDYVAKVTEVRME